MESSFRISKNRNIGYKDQIHVSQFSVCYLTHEVGPEGWQTTVKESYSGPCKFEPVNNQVTLRSRAKTAYTCIIQELFVPVVPMPSRTVNRFTGPPCEIYFYYYYSSCRLYCTPSRFPTRKHFQPNHG